MQDVAGVGSTGPQNPKYHRNLLQFMLYGDPSIQLR